MDTHLEEDSQSSRKIQQKKHVEKDFTKHENNHSRLKIKNSQLEIEKTLEMYTESGRSSGNTDD